MKTSPLHKQLATIEQTLKKHRKVGGHSFKLQSHPVDGGKIFVATTHINSKKKTTQHEFTFSAKDAPEAIESITAVVHSLNAPKGR